MRRLVTLAVLIGLASCGSDKATGPSVPGDVNGVWTGVSAGTTVNLTLATQGTNVTGSGQISQGTTSVALTITSGTYVAPNLSLTVSAQGFQAVNLAGVRSNNTITGTLNGSGFSNQALTLTKQ
jgi:hypothetical protein